MESKKYNVVLDLEVFLPYSEYKLKKYIEEEILAIDGISLNKISVKEDGK